MSPSWPGRIDIQSWFVRVYDEAMDEDVTMVQLVRGSPGGAVARRSLTDAQRRGIACLVCGGVDEVNTHVGYVDDVSVKVHSYHVEKWRMGETVTRA